MTWFKLYDSRWEKAQAAFRRDWEQTRHDLGSDRARDLKQSAGNTLSQIFGDDPIPVGSFAEHEPAFRYGYAAGAHHDQPWSADLDRLLAEDYPGDWQRDATYVHYAYLYYQRTRTAV